MALCGASSGILKEIKNDRVGSIKSLYDCIHRTIDMKFHFFKLQKKHPLLPNFKRILFK